MNRVASAKTSESCCLMALTLLSHKHVRLWLTISMATLISGAKSFNVISHHSTKTYFTTSNCFLCISDHFHYTYSTSLPTTVIKNPCRKHSCRWTENWIHAFDTPKLNDVEGLKLVVNLNNFVGVNQTKWLNELKGKIISIIFFHQMQCVCASKTKEVFRIARA